MQLQEIKRLYNLAKDSRFFDKKIRLADKDISRNKAVSIITKLNVETKQLTQKEIARWRNAHQLALFVEDPKRYELYSIYDDALLDLHLAGAIRNRKLAVMASPFRLTNENGKTDDAATSLINKKWFRKFVSLALDSRFYGHSLIQFDNIIREPQLKFKDVELVPREHVCPEYGTILKNISDSAKDAMAYRETPLMDWAIEVGDKDDLGELLGVSKETISKKFVMQFWDQFAEIFGMPIRMATTTSRNPKDKAAIENMLDQMGSAAWGLFPEGTTIEMIASKQTDAYEVYDKRIERVNSEISKKILGQTMTMDDGSSLSQANVHAEVAEDIKYADRIFLHDVINDDLLPFLVRHGFPVKGLEFVWDDTYTYSPNEMTQIEQMLLNHYDIDAAYFEEKYGVKISGSKQQITDPEKKKLTRPTLPDWILSMQEE